MVDFSQRCPVLADATPLVRGAPEIEQTSADILILLQINYAKFIKSYVTTSTIGSQYLPDIIQFILSTFNKFCIINIIVRAALQMRNTEFQLTDFNKKKKPIEFDQISPEIKKNVLRLLNRQYEEHRQLDEGMGIYCWFYIDPLSNFTLFWNLFYMFIFYLVQLQISLSLAFGPKFFDEELAARTPHRIFYIAVLLYYCLDIFLSFFKGYYSYGRGKVVDDWLEIRSNYIRTQLYFDIIVVVLYAIPLIYIRFGLNFLQLLTAGLLWIKKFKYQYQIINYLQYQPTARIIFTLFILFVDVLMIGNYGACVFIGMDILLYNSQYYGSSTAYYWLTNNTSYPQSLITGPWYYQYIYGQQFSTGTLSTLAPGPFAKNPIECVYAIVVMILFMVLASYAGEVLIQIVYTFSERRIFHEENIISFENFMQLKEVEKSVRNRIYNFFQLIWEVELKMESKQQEALIDKLPNYLKQELLLQIGFTKSIYFLNSLPQQHNLQKMISFKLQRTTIDSNTCLFETEKNNIANRNIYFVKEGMAKFYLKEKNSHLIKNSEKILNLTNVERVLGIYQFITGQDYCVCCKSIDLCLLQKLSYQNFIAIINQLNIWEQYKQLQQKVLISRQLKLLNKVCVLCLQSHMQSQCPELYFHHRVTDSVIKSQCFTKNQKRVQYKRRNFSKKRAIEKGGLKNPQENVSIFNLFTNINLGKLILDVNKLTQMQMQMLDEVKIYNNYHKTFNITD